MKTIAILMLSLLFVFLIAGCAASPNTLTNTPDTVGKIAGFWQGIWHGIIAPVTFLISLFNHNISVYEVHNNGAWYNFGFLLGIGAFTGSGGAAASRRRPSG